MIYKYRLCNFSKKKYGQILGQHKGALLLQPVTVTE